VKHKSIDLASEVKRATLPDGLQGFLFPLFEAVSNALHSIEERWKDEAEEKGQIEVEVSFADQSITIADNGTGFDQKNLDAFLTPLTGNKFERGGKGFGRFIAFKLFDQVFYSSRQTDPSGAATAGTYRYEPFAADDNLIPVASEDGAGVHRFDRGLTARMQSPHDDVSNYFDPMGDRYPGGEAMDAIAFGLVDHFLVEFIQNKVPRKFSLIVDGIPTNLYDHFYASLSIGGSRTEQVEVIGEPRLFEFSYFKVGVEQARKHRLYFYANNRAASDLENISSGLNDRPFEEDGPDGPRKYYYLVAVSSDFFVSSQSRDRITNLNVKLGETGRQKTIRETLIALAKQHILELESEYTAERRAKMVADVEHLIAVDPSCAVGWGTSRPPTSYAAAQSPKRGSNSRATFFSSGFGQNLISRN